MKLPRLLWLFLLPLTVFAGSSSLVFEPAGEAKGKHVVLLSGDEEYRSEESLPMLAKILSQRHGFKCTVLFAVDPDGTINPDNNAALGDASALDSADAIIMALRWRNYPDEVMKHFVDAHRRGVPIIALRTSTHAFKLQSPTYAAYNRFGKEVLGEDWVDHWGHHNHEATRAVVDPAVAGDPLLNGVSDIFGPTDVYEVYPPADVKVLLRGQVLKGMQPDDPPADRPRKRKVDGVEQPINNPMMPIAWTRIHRNEAGTTNRVFCTTMGAAVDLRSEDLRRLLVNATYWAFELPIPARADVATVGAYEPRYFGSTKEGFKRGMKPADYGLAAKPCVFCEIAAGRGQQESVVYRDELVVAFLSTGQRNPGHTLVVPVKHADDFLAVPPETMHRMTDVAHGIVEAIKRTDIRMEGFQLHMSNGRAGGQAVFHAHLHVIPRFEGDAPPGSALPPKRDGDPFPQSVLAPVAAKIRAAMDR